MFFTVAANNRPLPAAQNCAVLVVDYWDDWGKYRTMFTLTVFDENGAGHLIGSVKIGQEGLRASHEVAPGQRAPDLPESFDQLDARFFSLGQGENYYESLNELNADLRLKVLRGLRDCAFDLETFARNRDEIVMGESLLRSVGASTVRSRLHRLTRGDAQLTPFLFDYTLPAPDDVTPTDLSFEVVPASNPPTNVHVLIGRNGVGKSRCMRHLIQALLGRQTDEGASPGTVVLTPHEALPWSFAGLVLVSFSAFDDFDLRALPTDAMNCEQVGLRRRTEVDGQENSGLKSPGELATDFRKSLERCRQGVRIDRWRAALATLETDDLFAEADAGSLLDQPMGENWEEDAERLFKRLSSGHAIVLLTITRLIELVDERTLVLLDEPEGHLHPPLLSAFIRCLSDLLVKRNGVAIVATHSPVVLQEVPRSCAWKLRRSRAISLAERPSVETFGENIGILTREVFGLEVTRSGFHELLRRSVESGRTYEQVLEQFGEQLGFEAQAIVMSLIAERDRER